MKLKNIFATLLAGLVIFNSCDQEESMFLSEVRVSSSYIGLPAAGGSKTITLTASGDWAIDIPETVASWLTVNPVSGKAGTVEVTFTAAETATTNSAALYVICSGKSQTINVLQQTKKVELPISSSKVVNAAEDGTTWRVKGVVRGIENTTYGNYYIDDADGSVYIYGTLNNGETKKFAALGIEAGDIITVEGKRGSYNGNPQLVNVDVIAIEKSLIKVEEVDPENAELPKEGGVINVTLTVKGDGVMAVVPDAAKSWLSVGGIAVDGTLAVVQLVAAANEGGDRSVQLTFMTPKGDKEYTAALDVTQKGAIIDATAAEINAAEDGTTQYRIQGVVSKIANTKYGNLYIKDATGEVFVYGTNDFAASGIEEDDIITVVGPKTSHNDAPQMKNVTVENRIPVQDIDLASFRALEDNKNAWYKISGKVVKSSEEGTKFDLTQYGNFALSDGTTEVYVYGVKTGWGGTKGQFGTLEVKEGDELTIICYKTSYKGLIEADGCVYVSHVAAE
ncbi:MAG: BACON domain-containing carbohydrate-binding protein [Candidatus Cryptobacteroides sp.]|nr:BACON domain-containing carbohydrate-binding protein [Rikenellaceae bacterium]MDY5747204.1 BACON domain-containing carbohydrate-binding protein [Candidatus Cryptobacteroides sp.]